MQFRLLFSIQRSGSHFLKSFIAARYPAVVCSGEVLEKPAESQSPVLPSNPEITRFWPWYIRETVARSISAAPDKRLAAFEFYMNKLIWVTEPNDLVIDVKYDSVRALGGYIDTEHGSFDFTSFIQNRNTPVLHLIRKNTLKIILSDRLARQTGTWHRSTEKTADEPKPRIYLEPKELLRDLAYRRLLTRDYQNHFRDYPHYEEVVYEDFVHEQNQPDSASMRALTRFIGKAPLAENQVPVWCKKTTPEDPSEIVENWDEVVRAFRGTADAWMTETPLLAVA